MKKSHKIIWGILTLMPIMTIIIGVICMLAFVIHIIPHLPQKGDPTPSDFPASFIGAIFGFYALIAIGVISAFLVHVSYFIHLVRNDEIDKNMKTMWVVLFLIVNILAMIIYWFLNVWPEPKSKPPEIPK